MFHNAHGQYSYKKMPFRLRNTPEIFQRVLEIILSRVRWKMFLVYLDDVILFSQTLESNCDILKKVLKFLRSAGVSTKLIKFAFFQENVD